MKKLILIIMVVVNLFAVGNPIQAYRDIGSNTLKTSSMEYMNKSKKEKISYKELISFLKNSNDPKKIALLGILYSTDSNIPDDYGNYIKHDIHLAQKYLLQSYHMGNIRALSILGGLILYNDNMSKLDKDLTLTEKYLSEAYKKGDKEAGLLLGNTQILKGQYNKGVKTLMSIKNDPEVDLSLALIFQKGIYSEKDKKMVIMPDYDVANFYLNKACSSENKSENVSSFCNSLIVEKVVQESKP